MMSTDHELSAFADRVREWLDANVPRRSGHGDKAYDKLEAKRVQGAMYRAGFGGIAYPREYGGQGLDREHQRIFNEISEAYSIPFRVFFVGLGMCAPTLLDLGTEEQKRRFLPKLLGGEEIWCQLFSEPGAGSDVAGLQTRAERCPGGWRVTGQKVWSSGAQHSEFGILVARTDPAVPKHAGISMFILDMTAPGVTVRPLVQITGASEFNEVFFDDVFVPEDRLVGEVNRGWAAAVIMLKHERVSVGALNWSQPPTLSWEMLARRLARQPGDGRRRDRVRARIAELRALDLAAEHLSRMHQEEEAAGHGVGSRGSVVKLARANQRDLSARIASEMGAMELAVPDPAIPEAAQFLTDVLHTRSAGIAGGTNEIQRNIIGERVLGLPPEPRVDKDVPFRDLRVGTQRRPAGP
jgi:alkylation response protein AidB-like acyl-CoA dehydrogenase